MKKTYYADAIYYEIARKGRKMNKRNRFFRFVIMCFHNSILRYIFFGGLTTLVNLISYFVLTKRIDLNYNVANVISVALAIVFAYVVNSRYVFESKAHGLKNKMNEFCVFVSARISTMIIEVGGVFILTSLCGINDGISKLIVQVIVLILNYIFSKLIVFK